jgi:hypothetical protein
MSIFDANSATQTEFIVGGSGGPDYALPKLGMLNLKKIDSLSPFDAAPLPQGVQSFGGKTITGQDCKIIHGDIWEQIGTSSWDVGNATTIIQGDQHFDVDGEADIKLGSRTLHIFKDDKVIEDGNRDVTVSGTDTETYASPREIEEPSHWESNDTDMGWKGYIAEVCALKTEACLVLHLELKDLHVCVELFKATGDFLSNKIQGLVSRINVLDAKVGALDAKAEPRVNAAPTESVTAPIAGA